MDKNQWELVGVEFVEDDVAKRAGPNASDKRLVGKATIAMIRDLDKFRSAYGDGYILRMADGTSLRVTCQRMWRDNPKMAFDEFSQRLDGVFRNARVTGGTKTVTVEVVKHDLPDGTVYEGMDEVEYRQLYAAGMVDLGTPGNVAVAIAARKMW